jgi:hypothetical protein
VAEANALIPTLEGAFRRLLPVQAELRRAYAQLEKAGLTGPAPPAAPDEPADEARGIRGRFLGLALALAEEYEGLEAIGVQVKDPEIGLCDFPSIRGGRLVLLCWRLGEPSVDYWHELDAGYAGRVPLETRGGAHTVPRGLA